MPPGRHAVALARRGLRVTGVDRTQFLLDQAAVRAREAGVTIELVREDMRRFQRPAAFDLVLSLWTSFGYFESRDDDRAVLAAIHGNLRPGGVAVFDMASKEHLCAHFQPTLVTPPAPDGSFLVQRTQVIEDWSRVKNDWLLIKDGTTRAFTFFVRTYSGQELKDLLAGAGFASVTLFGALDGRAYGVDVERLIAVARKA
jgi:SAM-dependent methyltransferase